MNPRLALIGVLLFNWLALVLGRGVRGWVRNLVSVSPAFGSMVVLLAVAGMMTIGAVAITNAVAAKSNEAYVLRVYLADQATPDQVGALRTTLAADPRVRQVRLASREEALRQELRRPGVAGLVNAAGDNPFPASLDVTLTSPSAIGAVAASVSRHPAVDALYPTSFDRDAYAHLQRLMVTAAGVAAAVFGLLVFVALTVTANAVRAAAVARLDEVRVMRLVGAPWWAVRLPFLVEGGLTGAAAGVVAAALVAAFVLGSLRASAAVFTEFVPGVGVSTVAVVAGAVIGGGVLLGSSAGAFALRRLPR
jgi:cell division transport system permease protein